MDREQWEKVERLYHAARELDGAGRARFFDENCASDSAVRREVETLLEQGGKSDDFLNAIAASKEVTSFHTMLSAGTQLGPYRVEHLLGRGGMGQVYRARDTRLNRTVAIKILSSHFSTDSEMKQRFEREAEILAGLNHAHICVLHDVGHSDGVEYLVMELLEGEPLSTRLQKGRLPIEQVLRYGAQIADALAAAHARGIIHRDLKPSNIMLTKSGVKVLDFGLARSAEDETLTHTGVVMGTPRYMPPEQAAGRDTDARTDIFALGLVLHEMATDATFVQGQSSLADFDERFAHVLERCLATDPANRWQNASDVKAELDWAAKAPLRPAAASNSRSRWLMAVALILVVIAGGSTVWYFRKPVAIQQNAFRLQIAPPAGGRFVPGNFTVSPDARAVAFVATVNGRTALWVRSLDGAIARMLPGTEGAEQPFWSPDSKSLAFFAASKLQRVDLSGGAPVTIWSPVGSPRGGSWDSDGRIIYAEVTWGLFQVPASGGTRSPLTTLDTSRGERAVLWPQVLQGGRFLYFGRNANPENTGVYVASFKNPDNPTRLVTTDSSAVVASGAGEKTYLLWLRNGTLVAQQFDPTAVQLTGPSFAIADPVDTGITNRMQAAASDNGVLLYIPSGLQRQLTWFDPSGKPIAAIGEPGRIRNFGLSPDSRRVVVARTTGGPDYDLWIVETDRDVSSRFTFVGNNVDPLWSPDGRRVIFTRIPDLFVTEVNGNAMEQQLTHLPHLAHATDWSRDGRLILYYSGDPETNRDLWILPMSEGGSKNLNPQPYLRTRFNELNGRFSSEPSPHWVAYQSDESGRYEIYVRSFPDPDQKLQISKRGGSVPSWSADGRKLLYISPENKLVVVDLKIENGSITTSAPQELFALPSDSNFYQVTQDGGRVLVSTPVEDVAPLNVIVNWPALLQSTR
jgi:Tol biopolymer transport system component